MRRAQTCQSKAMDYFYFYVEVIGGIIFAIYMYPNTLCIARYGLVPTSVAISIISDETGSKCGYGLLSTFMFR